MRSEREVVVLLSREARDVVDDDEVDLALGRHELEAKLTRLAAETGRTADQVALDLLASSVDHDEWFRAEVEKGRTAAREGKLLEHDDVAARMGRRYRG